MSRIERFISLRFLGSKRKEIFISISTVISVLGVALSVLVLNVTLGIMTGLEAELQTKLIDANAHILVRQYGKDITDYNALVERIRTVPGVTGATPYSQSQAMISTPRGSHGLLIRGANQDDTAIAKIEKLIGGDSEENTENEQPPSQLIFGSPQYLLTRPDGSEDFVEMPPLLVGEMLRNNFGLRVGEPVTIIAPSFSASPQGAIPKLRRFLVTGTYHSGLRDYESGVAYTSLESAQQFFNMQGAVSGIEVFIGDRMFAEKITEEIHRLLNRDGIMYQVLSWKDLNRPLWEALKLEKQVYFLVLLLLILLASFAIVSSLVMIVMEKSKDIAILKSMGLSNKSVLRIFLMQGVTIGGIGTIAGTILGYFGCIGLRAYGFPLNPAVFAVSEVPVYIIPSNFIIVAISAFIITSFSGIYPALRAAKLNTAEILRYE